MAEVVAGIVEEVEDGGVADAEAAAFLTDTDAGIIFDETVPADFIEQTPAFVLVHGFGAGAGREADEGMPCGLEEFEGAAVGVIENVVGAKGAEGAEHNAWSFEKSGDLVVVRYDEIAAAQAVVIGEDEARGFLE